MDTSFRSRRQSHPDGSSTTSTTSSEFTFRPPTTTTTTHTRRSEKTSASRSYEMALALVVLLPLCIFLSRWTTKMHYALPRPLTNLYDPTTGLPQLSETAMLAHAQHLSETIGYRTVGTREHAMGDKYVLEQAELIQRQCEDVVLRAANIGKTRRLQCEVWRQEGSGTHRFDMMNKRVYKHYEKLSNIILRVSDGTAAGKEHAILLNAHVDSTLPSPGAADDALSVGIQLEVARVLINTPTWEPRHAVVFLFNNAEESLQDGSHLFTTQSAIASTVRAVINLEAAGTTGPEILFQATSEEMVEAYSHVPRPYATVLANDVFQSGIILSDTDFRQFQEYGNLTGLDMAIVGSSYLYHTRKDLVENIEPGAAQHFADNVYAIVHYLTTSPSSPLPQLAKGATPVTSLYYSMLGRWFIHYEPATARKIFTVALATSLAILISTAGFDFVALVAKSIISALLSIVGAILSANVVAFIMKVLLNARMSWYSKETSCLVLYGPPTLAGALAAQYFIRSNSSSTERRHLEFATFKAFHFLFIFIGMALQALNLGSATLMTQFALVSTAATGLNAIVNSLDGRRASWTKVGLLTYVVAIVVPVVTGTQLTLGFLDIFVPLTGRMGEVAPVEHIIATITAVVVLLTGSFLLPLAHRVGRKILMNFIIILIGSTAIIMFFFAFVREPYDPMHQKRIFALHVENVGKRSPHWALTN
ncbi:hypothetical protein FRC03_001987 [Tulasnella sp. 419]|nr:hypothetical protein FRC03_001987 [Tulasnella sp. 419]